MSQCVGDDVDAEAPPFNLVDGETDAVERHRSFRGDVARQLRRCLDREADRVALRPPFNELRDTVNMPGDEMAAKLVAEPQRALEIDGSPRSEEHTSELQSRENLVCRLLLEKKK